MRNTLKLCLLLFPVGALLVFSLVYMTTAKRPPVAASGSVLLTPPATESPLATSAQVEVSVPPAGPPMPVFEENGVDRGSNPVTAPEPPRVTNVQQAAVQRCSTESIEGLNRQLIEEARCLEPNAFVPIPARPNLELGKHVFPYLESSARTHLLHALDTHRKQVMVVNSAVRTIAQQYLVRRWAEGSRCGVQLANAPGESNHEAGLALDIATPELWRTALEQEGFRWLGITDRVHFDYKPGVSQRRLGVDVLAFQKLWNRNHPEQKIAEDAHYSAETERLLKTAPADGFAVGASCSKHAAKTHVAPSRANAKTQPTTAPKAHAVAL